MGTGAVIWAVADISWRASAVVAEVQQHEARIDKLESRLDSKLDAIGKQLERLETHASNEEGPPGGSNRADFFGLESPTYLETVM